MRLLSILILVLSSLCLRAQSESEAYIARFDSLAVKVLNNYGIPASLVLGIALQESAAGSSKLCRAKHNHFGIKGRVKSSKTRSGYTTAYRNFATDEDAYLNFGELISHRKYYAGLKNNMDYLKWLRAMKASGYAASSKWIGHVNKMIKRYDLTRFDLPADEQVILLPAVGDSLRPAQR